MGEKHSIILSIIIFHYIIRLPLTKMGEYVVSGDLVSILNHHDPQKTHRIEIGLHSLTVFGLDTT